MFDFNTLFYYSHNPLFKLLFQVMSGLRPVDNQNLEHKNAPEEPLDHDKTTNKNPDVNTEIENKKSDTDNKSIKIGKGSKENKV